MAKKVASFNTVMEKYNLRAGIFFPTKEFSNGVRQHAEAFRETIEKQEGKDVNNIPPETVLGKEAQEKFDALTSYLEEHDSAVLYTLL